MTSHTAKSDMPTLKKHLLKVDPSLFAVLACFILFAWASWGKLELPFIDVGREVEIPARILTGQVLYRDIATYYGPLAYYANALFLLLFGQRLEVFYAVGIGLALVATLLFYRLAKRLTDGPWAALSTTFMLIYCALGGGLFNFMLPYSYGAAYAIVLCLLAIAALDCYLSTGTIVWLVAASIACGLAGVSKQEYGVAALGSLLVGTNLYFPQSHQTRVKHSVLVLMVAGVCALLPYSLIAQQVSWGKMLSFLFPVSDASVLNRSILFQVTPIKTIKFWLSTFRTFFAGSLIIFLSTITAQRISKSIRVSIPQWLRTLLDLLVGFALAWVSLKLISLVCESLLDASPNRLVKKIIDSLNGIKDPLKNLSWSIPVIIWWFAVNRPQKPQYKAAPLMWTLLVFSLLLNARWLFVIDFYGLYAPPILLLFFTLFYHLTQPIKAIKGLVWRYLAVCLLVAGSVKLEMLAGYVYAPSSSYGTFYTNDSALVDSLNKTIKAIELSRATSVLVLPEGNIVNFLTGTHSPSRELTFLPIALPHPEDEQNFVERMQSNPPELIVYVPRKFLEWNYKSYAEFNPIVDRWITTQHKLIYSFPMNKDAIRIYARN
ncbi:MAG: glycosyltransferase family 39 protein [Stigonema ocellatum SAG 48.90 = DSM 106950]|nr:glycosyltransferase family 39 protein [Stigonema ocellatum SAG 48.90 = DSM 106950]